MTTDRLQIEVSGIPITIDRKAIKNLHVGVYPPDGRVRVAAPERMGAESIRLAIVSRLGWIRRQQKGFADQPRQSEREMVTGESHYFRGRRYKLDVVERESAPHVHLRNTRVMELATRPGAGPAKRAEILNQWYRRQLRADLEQLVPSWASHMGLPVPDWGIKKMKTKWGSCNPSAPRIWLNLELAKKPPNCVEYILVHELVHLMERHHNQRFRALMDQYLPDWRARRDLLNTSPLAHEEWQY